MAGTGSGDGSRGGEDGSGGGGGGESGDEGGARHRAPYGSARAGFTEREGKSLQSVGRRRDAL